MDLHYSLWTISLLVIAFLAFKVSGTDELREESFSKGRQEAIKNLRDYFDEYPSHYKEYEQWLKKRDSVSNQK
ncbi:hypothetical protein [Maribacter antarcticus]|uniref:hypothetical protein n=1 Tax=Maribacter antarcticus TaxID=505250 RepID=UPI000B2EACAD|nr:hypothetical protein [Maribacter antarcticus]